MKNESIYKDSNRGQQAMSNEYIQRSTEGHTDILDFIEQSIELLLRSGRPFIICSAKGIPPMIIKKDEDGIWVTLVSEL